MAGILRTGFAGFARYWWRGPLAAILFAHVVYAADEPPVEPQADRQDEPWAPPPPPPDDWDWIQLTSGEWLKGDIKVLQDRKLEFKSDKLKDLTFKMKDIAYIRSGRQVDVRSDDRTMFTGMLVVDKRKVVVTDPSTGDVEIQYAREELQGVAPYGAREIDLWSAKLSLGGNLRKGNTESVDITARADIQRRTPRSRGRIEYIGNFNSVNSEDTADNHRVTTTFDFFLNRRVFLRPLQSDYFRDVFQNIEYRLTYGVSAGYYFYNKPGLEWVVSGGPSYQRTVYSSVTEDQENLINSASLVLGSRYEVEITKDIDLTLDYQVTFVNEDSGNRIWRGVNTLEIELTKAFDLDVSLTWDRVENPRPGEDGTIPKQDDFRLSLSLSVDI